MKNIFFSIILILSTAAPSTACDICGSFMGITPYDNQSSINFNYRYRSFNGYSSFGHSNQIFPAFNTSPTSTESNNNFLSEYSQQQQSAAFKTGTPATPQIMHGTNHSGDGNVKVFPDSDYEIYNVYELRAKYFVHQRIEINGIIPVNNCRSVEGSSSINHTGLGDITLFAAYHALRKIETEAWQHRLIMGGGIKLPVGNYYAQHHDERIPLLLQPGTGSIDYFVYFNYIVGYKKLGLNVNSMYKMNGENYYHERIANSTSNYVNAFYKIPLNDSWMLIPSAQFYYEYTAGIKVHNNLQPATFMNVGMFGPGLDVFYKNISINTSFQYRVFEKVAEGNMGSAGRIIIGIAYNFKQNNYLIKGKKKDEE